MRTSARNVALRALVALEREPAVRLSEVLEVQSLPPRDQALARELALGSERQRLLLDFVLTQLVERELPRDPRPLSTLRLGAYQLLFLWRVKVHAAVHETVALLQHQRGFVNAVLRNLSRRIHDQEVTDPRRQLALPGPGPRAVCFDEPVLPQEDPERVALQHALPEFLVRGWWQELGPDAAARACAGSSGPPAVTLWPSQRVVADDMAVAEDMAVGGDKAVGGEALARRLASEGVETEPLPGTPLWVWTGGASPFAGATFQEGWFLVQGPAAHVACLAMEAGPGHHVLDLCAAPGTKTMVLAEAVGPTGKVFAFDVDLERRQQILANGHRLGLADRVVLLDTPPAASQLPPLDRVLVDAPCSNSGVLSRRVEVRRRIHPNAIGRLARQQQDLLQQGIALCRPGGRVVYSTCSLEARENRLVVEGVLGAGDESPSCRLVHDQLTLPEAPARDGGYFAALETML